MSQYLFPFSHSLFYDSGPDIIVPVYVSSGIDAVVSIDAKLDTGSTYCIFQPRYADMLEIDIESGVPQPMRTATGSFMTFGHEVTISLKDLEWQAMVFFVTDEFFPVNVIGRVGFLDKLRIALIDYDQELYFSHYNE